jgi:hypothetical protein
MFMFPLDLERELDVFRHDGGPLGMDGTQVCILKNPTRYALEASCDVLNAED